MGVACPGKVKFKIEIIPLPTGLVDVMFVQEKGARGFALCAREAANAPPSLMRAAAAPDRNGDGLREKRDIFVGDLPRRQRGPLHQASKRGGGRMTSRSAGARRSAAPLYVSLGLQTASLAIWRGWLDRVSVCVPSCAMVC